MDTRLQQRRHPVGVLIVEGDSAGTREVRATLHGRADIQIVGESRSAVEALQLLDTIVVDVALVGLTGLGRDPVKTCRRITAHESGTPTIMMAHNSTPAAVIRAFGIGCHGFCRYGAGVEALGIAIHAANSGHDFLCPGVARPILHRYMKRTGDTSGQPGSLTRRQREVLRMVAHGWRTKEIACALGVSTKTVESHRAAIMRRLGVSRVVELVHEAARLGLAPPTD